MKSNEEVRMLVGNGKKKEAIQALKEILYARNEENNDLILVESNFNKIQRDGTLGLMSFSELSRANAQINVAILNLNDVVNPSNFSANLTINVINSPAIVNVWMINNIDYKIPANFKDFLKKERMGVASEFQEVKQVAKQVLAFLKGKYSNRDYFAI